MKSILNNLIWIIICWNIIYYSIYPQSMETVDNNKYPKLGEKWYVISPRGINLRSNPSEKSSVLAKLINHATVKILEQSKPEIYSKIKYLDVKSSENNKSGQMILEGRWVKVEYKGIKGFVFGPLISHYPPIQSKEFKEGYDITPYLIRIFSLKKIFEKRKQVKDGPTKYWETIYEYKSKDHVLLNVEQAENEYAWGNAKLFLPHWELEESIVFFYSIFYFPDFMTTDLSYIKEKSAEFSLDEIPNTIYFKKSKQGVSVEWNWGAD